MFKTSYNLGQREYTELWLKIVFLFNVKHVLNKISSSGGEKTNEEKKHKC